MAVSAPQMPSGAFDSCVKRQPLRHTQVNRTLHLLLERHQLRRSLLDDLRVAAVLHPHAGFKVVSTRGVYGLAIGEHGDWCVEWLQRSCPLWYGEDATDTDDNVVMNKAVAW